MSENEVKTNPIDRAVYYYDGFESAHSTGVVGRVVFWRREGVREYSLSRQACKRLLMALFGMIRSHKVELHPREFGYAAYPIAKE